ncbi:hypothetical protein [Streptomyces sp. NPDC001492]
MSTAVAPLGLRNLTLFRKEDTLINQVSRLARDLGGPLHERAERGRPMKLTALGRRVVKATKAWLDLCDEASE